MSLGSRLNALVDNPFNAVAPRGIHASPRIRQAQLLRPFPQFEELVGARDTRGRSWYNRLLLSGRKRMSYGLEFEMSYTWSKTIDFGEDLVQNEYDPMASRPVAQIDIPHRFIASFVYEMPVRQRPVPRRESSGGSGLDHRRVAVQWNRCIPVGHAAGDHCEQHGGHLQYAHQR
jgi:hypothetical protein